MPCTCSSCCDCCVCSTWAHVHMKVCQCRHPFPFRFCQGALIWPLEMQTGKRAANLNICLLQHAPLHTHSPTHTYTLTHTQADRSVQHLETKREQAKHWQNGHPQWTMVTGSCWNILEVAHGNGKTAGAMHCSCAELFLAPPLPPSWGLTHAVTAQRGASLLATFSF